MYAIRSKITGQWVYGTEYSNLNGGWPFIQRLSVNQALTFETREGAEHEMAMRRCEEGEFEIVKVELSIVQ